MMPSLILSTAARVLLPLLLVFSAFLLVRGHNAPGGGFAGGLVAATGFGLYALAHGVGEARRLLRVDPLVLAAAGLLVACGSGTAGMMAGGSFLTGLWVPFALPGIGKVGTPVLFDVGVLMVVAGITLTILFTLEED